MDETENRQIEKMTLNLKVNSKRDIASVASLSSPESHLPTLDSHKKVKSLPATEVFMDLLHQVKQVEEIKAIKAKSTKSWKEYFMYQWTEGIGQPLTVWCVWLLVGTMYFGTLDFENYAKGFYFSINVGYCVGWGVLSVKYNMSKVFAIMYMLVGAMFVLHYVTKLVQLAVVESNSAYEQLKIKRNIERSCSLTGWKKSLYVYLAMHNEKLFIIYVWFMFIFVGAFFSVAAVHWSWLDGYYFSIASMSTAGLLGIPRSSPDYLFVMTGLFTAVGVPVMAMAVSNIGLLIVEAKSEAAVEAVINQELQVTTNEMIDVLKLKEHNNTLFTISTTKNSDGAPVSSSEEVCIDRNEFLIVSLVRMKIIDVELIHDVLTKFDRVDSNQDGQLTLDMVKAKYESSNKVFFMAHSDSGRDKDVTAATTTTAIEMPSYIARRQSETSARVSQDGYQYLEDA